jgi:Xaa-Pro aminopeptidase
MKLNPKAVTGARCARRTLAAIAALLAIAAALPGRFRQASSEYQARREKLRATLDAPLVLFGFTGHEDASEVAVFFQEPYFYYLTGHNEPGAVVVVIPNTPANANTAGAHEVLYLPPRDRSEEQWEGPKLGPDEANIDATVGFESVRSTEKLPEDLKVLAKTFPAVYTVMPPVPEDGYPHFTYMLASLRLDLPPDFKVKDATAILDAMRMVKAPGEIALTQKAIDLSVDAQLEAMRMTHPGVFEYQIAARMKEVHEMGGCEREAYAPIVGTGFDSTVLHYSALDRQVQDGDLIVMDVGGEYGGYSADITRTIPANGKFTPRQREIYDIVLGAQNAVIDAVKPGVTMYGGPHNLQQIATDYINAHGRDKAGHPLGRYFIHGISHNMGLDVHDPGDRNLALKPGQIITVEPGVYIPEENIGVRIEDDVLVTGDGHKILTERLARTAPEVEQIMSKGASK